jgi:hypothetical protein
MIPCWHYQERDSFDGKVGQLSLSVFTKYYRTEDRPYRVVLLKWLKKQVNAAGQRHLKPIYAQYNHYFLTIFLKITRFSS